VLGPSQPIKLKGYVAVRSLVLNSRGGMAWIQCSLLPGQLSLCAVYRSDSDQPMRRLAGGRRINPRSLKLRGTRLSWIDNNRRRYSMLR